MTLGGVNPGDIMLADRKGRRFYAVVTERRERELEVEPIDRRQVEMQGTVGGWTDRLLKPRLSRQRHAAPLQTRQRCSVVRDGKLRPAIRTRR
jgi:hypothetical protein